MYYP
jgi:hypothetical protein